MLKRRDFLKGLLLGSGAFLIPQNPSFPIIDARADQKKKERGLYWTDTIFCQSNDAEIRALLKKFAERTDVNIFYGDRPADPDIIAVPNFLTIVNRNEISEEIWDLFILYRRESEDDTLCMVVDSRIELPLPEIKRMKYIDRSDPHALSEIEIAVVAEYKAVSELGPILKSGAKYLDRHSDDR